MAIGQQPPETTAEAPDTGAVVKETSRSIQRLNNSENCLGINIPSLAATVHDFDARDDAEIVIYENGIWIPRE